MLDLSGMEGAHFEGLLTSTINSMSYNQIKCVSL